MRLPEDDAKRFIDLYTNVLRWSARHTVDGPLEGTPMARMTEIRDRLFAAPEVLELYVAQNPDDLSNDDLECVAAWRRFVHGRFVVERNLKRHTIFLDSERPATAYAALSLTEEIVDIVPPLPTIVCAALLPWRGRIVCDGLLRFENVQLGPRLRAELKDVYREAKARGVVKSLDDPPAPRRPRKPRDSRRAFVGDWRIVEMELWDADYFEMDGPATIQISRQGTGRFEFGLVVGEMDCRFSPADDSPLLEFSWDGADEHHPAAGRGYARVTESGELRGRIFFHLGDDSEFVARRLDERPKRPAR